MSNAKSKAKKSSSHVGPRNHLLGATVDYVGSEAVDSILLSHHVISSLDKASFTKNAPKSGERFNASHLTSRLRMQATDFAPGSSVRIGQQGYRLAIFQYSFDGGPGGHTDHTSYNNNLPAEWRASDGQYTNITFGPACGVVTETVTVYTHDGRSGTGQGQVTVKIAGLQDIGASNDFVLIGHTTKHPSNHWGTPGFNTMLRSVASEYKQVTGDRLYFNDMSLVLGGIFDIAGTWNSPHAEHRNGTSIDIAATPVTMRNEPEFIRILRKYTTNYILEGSGTSRHYHVRG